MTSYVLKMNNCVQVREVSKWVVDRMLPHFQAIKDTSVSFSIYKILQGCVWKVDGFKSSDVVVISICRDSEDDMVLN